MGAGKPLPFIQCRLVNDANEVISFDEFDGIDGVQRNADSNNIESESGELQVRGKTLFKEYLNLKEATEKSFSSDGWFCTGDIAVRHSDGNYRLLGRKSSDIIKSNGYKLSALEIERVLLAHPWISEVAVVGVPHELHGECALAVVVLRSVGEIISSAELTTVTPSSSCDGFWIDLIKTVPINAGTGSLLQQRLFSNNIRQSFFSSYLAEYKHPRLYHFCGALPRNHLGKVNKKSLLNDCGIIKKK